MNMKQLRELCESALYFCRQDILRLPSPYRIMEATRFDSYVTTRFSNKFQEALKEHLWRIRGNRMDSFKDLPKIQGRST